MSTHALASLTATYTDSEPEGEEEDHVLQDEKAEDKSSEEAEEREDEEIIREVEPNAEQAGSVELSLEPPVRPPEFSVEPARFIEPTRVATLVSYHDDAEGDDDSDGEPRVADSPPLSGDAVELPPEPSGRVSPRMLEKVTRLHERMQTGLDMNALIQNRKEFRNPSIYEKLIQFCGINELGTNYPASMYDPFKWGKESFYEELARVQTEMEMKEREKKEKGKVEFVTGTKKPGGVEDEGKKRKSKWDQVGTASSAGGLLRASGLLQPALTTSATGTKSTVISAFGSLPKKPKF